MIYDAVIIGKGPAGVTAGIYLARANKKALILGCGYGSLEATEKIENYYACEPMSGLEFAKKGEEQAKRFGVEFINEEVTAVEYTGEFKVLTKSGDYCAKTVLIATGKPKKKLSTKGFDEFVGKGISFCAVCDGFLYRGKRLAVIGCGDYAAHEAEILRNFSDDITVFTNGEENASENLGDVRFVKEKITDFLGDKKISYIKTDGGLYGVDAVFVAIGTADSTGFAKTLGILTDDENIKTDENQMTNIKGIFAAGDCTGGFLQVVTASADGANAAVGILNYLKGIK